MPSKFIDKNRYFKPECNWHSCLPMSSTKHYSVSLSLSARSHRVVNSVIKLCRCNLIESRICRATAESTISLLVALNECTKPLLLRFSAIAFVGSHDVVPSFCFNFIHSIGSDYTRIGNICNHVVMLSRYSAELAVCLPKGSFNI